MSCAILTRDSLDALLDGRLRGRSLRAVRAHLLQPCDACLDLLGSEELSPFLERACRGESERGWTQLTEAQREFILHTAILGSMDILVADDDSSVPNGLAAILREVGHACEATSSAEQALAVAAATAPALIIANTNLIGWDGVPLLETFRVRFPKTCVISLSNNPDLDEAKECLRRGAVDYLIKPCERGDLIRAVERAVARRRFELAREQSKALRKKQRGMMNYVSPSRDISDDVSVCELACGEPTGALERGSTKGIALPSDKYPIGTQLTGKVRERTASGLIVDVAQGLDGLVRWSDISWSAIRCFLNRAEILKVGDEIEAIALDIFKDGDDVETALEIEKDCLTLSLGIKQLHPDPWPTLKERLRRGCHIKGKITGITKHATLVEIEPGVEGLLLGRGLSEKCPDNPTGEVCEGREVQVEVFYLDVPNRMLILTATPTPCEGEQYGETSTLPGWALGSKS